MQETKTMKIYSSESSEPNDNEQILEKEAEENPEQQLIHLRSSSRQRVESRKYKDYCTDIPKSLWASSSGCKQIPEGCNIGRISSQGDEDTKSDEESDNRARKGKRKTVEDLSDSPKEAKKRSVNLESEDLFLADLLEMTRGKSISGAVEGTKNKFSILAERFESTASALSLSAGHLRPLSPQARGAIQNLLNALKVNLKEFSQQQISAFSGSVSVFLETHGILEEPQREILSDMARQLPEAVAELHKMENCLDDIKKTNTDLQQASTLSELKRSEAVEAQKDIDALEEEEQELKSRLQECRAKRREKVKRRDQLNAESCALVEALPEKLESARIEAQENMFAMSAMETSWYIFATSLTKILNFMK